jgi:hypothetical protein
LCGQAATDDPPELAFRENAAEHSILLVIGAAHSLVSLPFLHSDEFF